MFSYLWCNHKNIGNKILFKFLQHCSFRCTAHGNTFAEPQFNLPMPPPTVITVSDRIGSRARCKSMKCFRAWSHYNIASVVHKKDYLYYLPNVMRNEWQQNNETCCLMNIEQTSNKIITETYNEKIKVVQT